MAKKTKQSNIKKWGDDADSAQLPIEAVEGRTNHVLRGLFVELRRITGPYGEAPVLVLDTGTGKNAERQTWNCPRQLERLFDDTPVSPGDPFAVVLLGTREYGGGTGFEFSLWRLDKLDEKLPTQADE